MQKEIDEIMRKLNEVKKANTVAVDDWPEIKRTFTYRKQIVIKPQDLRI